jgi:hypothetical protein
MVSSPALFPPGDTVVAVMVSGDWYEVQEKTFAHENGGFTFLNPDGRRFSGPVNVIQMVETSK